jgi:hypothetical protein
VTEHEQLLESAGTPNVKDTTNTPAPEPPAPPQEVRQFDFWLGDWECTWGEGQRGSNHIKAILGGLVVQENFNGEPTMPYHGLSVSVYSPSLKKWRQTWVDDAGTYLDFAGEFADGRMVLTRTAVEESSLPLQRMVWYNIAADTFDWDWQRSEDGGETWQTQWAIHYRRKARDLG